jgi:hypothetical protein
VVAHRSVRNSNCVAAIFGSFRGGLELVEATGVSYSGTSPPDKIPRRFGISDSARRISMVITAAHIQPIVALIAGVLILIMPRFLNLVVAIYLIIVGLAGLGLFKMLHM